MGVPRNILQAGWNCRVCRAKVSGIDARSKGWGMTCLCPTCQLQEAELAANRPHPAGRVAGSPSKPPETAVSRSTTHWRLV